LQFISFLRTKSVKITLMLIKTLVFALILIFNLSCSKEFNLSHSPLMGSIDSSFEIIIFSDFQCHFCKKYAAKFHELKKNNPNGFKVYFKHYPLKKHDFAHKAAAAAQAAHMQGKFWEMHDLLFAYSARLNDETILSLAQKINLDINKFLMDMNSQTVLNIINADIEEGNIRNITGTPTLFINDKKFSGSLSELEQLLKY
jgi:protein-disulfide isomerase